MWSIRVALSHSLKESEVYVSCNPIFSCEFKNAYFSDKQNFSDKTSVDKTDVSSEGPSSKIINLNYYMKKNTYEN